MVFGNDGFEKCNNNHNDHLGHNGYLHRNHTRHHHTRSRHYHSHLNWKRKHHYQCQDCSINRQIEHKT